MINNEENVNVPYNKHKTTVSNVFKGIAMGVLAVTCSAMMFGCSPSDADYIFQDATEHNEIVETNIRHAVGGGYWYDIGNIAYEVMQSEDVERTLYYVYKNMNYDVRKNFGEVVQRLGYDGFDDFFISNGYVDNEGKASPKAFKEAWEEKILDERDNQKGVSK